MAAQELHPGQFEEILFLLRTAREHGYAAVRNDVNTEKDSQFRMFINMLAGNVKAVLSMLNLKRSVEVEGGFFFSFLETNHASAALQTEEYERRARDIIRCVLKTLELADGAFENLKRLNHEQFTEPERERYAKAAEHHRNLIEQRPDIPDYRSRAGRYV